MTRIIKAEEARKYVDASHSKDVDFQLQEINAKIHSWIKDGQYGFFLEEALYPDVLMILRKNGYKVKVEPKGYLISW